MSQCHQRCFKFGPFCIYTDQRILTRDNDLVRLPPKTFETLLLLIECRDRVVDKQELIRSLWPDTFVEDINLTVHISRLRKIFGEGPNDHHYIITIPRRGYRFVAAVEETLDRDSTTEIGLLSTEPDGESPSMSEDIEDQVPPSLPPVTNQRQHVKLIAAGIAFTLVVLIASYWFSNGRTGQSKNHYRIVAVLPFQFIGDSDDQYMSSSIADTLSTKLRKLPNLTVRPVGAFFKEHGDAQDPLAAGRDMGVDAVIYGNVQRSATGLKVIAQLSRVTDGKLLWAQSFDLKPADMLGVQDSIAEQTAEILLPSLTTDERHRLANNGTKNPQAYEEYMWGLFFWNKRTDEGLRKAIDYFQRATLHDPNFGQAYAALADSYSLCGYYKYMQPGEAFPLAKAAATRALEIDDTIALAHISLGMVKSDYEHNMAGQIQELARAVEVDPTLPTAHQRYGWSLVFSGHIDQALVEMKRAVDLDPLSVANNVAFGQVLLFTGRYDDAIQYSSKAIELDNSNNLAHFTLGVAYQQKGRVDEALKELKQAEGDDTTSIEALGTLGQAYAMAGQTSEAVKILDKLKVQSKHDLSASFAIAMIYVGMGDKENALAALERATDSGSRPAYPPRFDPRVATLREDPRFDQAMQAMERPRRGDRR